VDEAQALPAVERRVFQQLLELVEVGGPDREGECTEGLAQFRRATGTADHRNAMLASQRGRGDTRPALGAGKKGEHPLLRDELARVFPGALGICGVVERDERQFAAVDTAAPVDLVEVDLRAEPQRTAVIADGARERHRLADHQLRVRGALRTGRRGKESKRDCERAARAAPISGLAGRMHDFLSCVRSVSRYSTRGAGPIE